MADSAETIASRALNRGKGIVMFRKAAWVPRTFCEANMNLRLAPHLYYALGPERGMIDERWLSSFLSRLMISRYLLSIQASNRASDLTAGPVSTCAPRCRSRPKPVVI